MLIREMTARLCTWQNGEGETQQAASGEWTVGRQICRIADESVACAKYAGPSWNRRVCHIHGGKEVRGGMRPTGQESQQPEPVWRCAGRGTKGPDTDV